jgi:formylglycine-generating enzyme required for sulfatase activity
MNPAGPPYEQGWDPGWDVQLAKNKADWDTNLLCDYDFSTWTPGHDASERLPINCVSWYEAYAFCIWDHGFLPSEAEWAYAAAGGDLQRDYPWGSTDPGVTTDLAVYDCHAATDPASNVCRGVENIGSVGLAGAGRSRWGQWDMAGNVNEWTLDAFAPYVSPCNDCAVLGGSLFRVYRGGAFASKAADIRTTKRQSYYPTFRRRDVGVRCARVP